MWRHERGVTARAIMGLEHGAWAWELGMELGKELSTELSAEGARQRNAARAVRVACSCVKILYN